MKPERARWLLDNPFPNPYTNATATEIWDATAPYLSDGDGWRALIGVDL